MSLWDVITVISPDGNTTYKEGVDYEIDYDNDTISRVPDGGIPDGESVVVKYSKGVGGQVIDALKEHGEAVLRPVKALVKILPSADAYLLDATNDLTDKIVRIEFKQTLAGRQDEVELVMADPSAYATCDPESDVIIGAAFGEVDEEGEEHYVECFRGLVVEREFVANPEGAHHVRVLVKDFSVALDAPRQGAMARTWHPTLRREVFKNGALIADDYRALRSAELYDSLNFDDIIELHFAQEYPQAHQIIRDCFEAAASPFLSKIMIDCLDFPIPFVDAREKTPGRVIREIAQLAGASVRAEGTTLVISERGFPDGFRTCWVYDSIAILDEREHSEDDGGVTAVQIYGHSETSRLPTKSVYLPPTDFTQPGWCRIVDEEGKLEPNEPVRSDDIPQPAELNFQLDGELYNGSSIRVLGGELAGKPEIKVIDDKQVIEVTVLIDWKVEDKAGECPYVLDENGTMLFRIHGKVFDAVPNSDGEKPPIPHAAVRREALDGDDPGNTFDISADDNGDYLFEAVPEGKYKIIASAPGYLNNYADDDTTNDEVRDLHEELQQYQDEIDKGRYEKQETDYHVIVWARPKVDMGPLADLTVSQVLMEVRLESTNHGTPLVYGPTIRDERITTEVLAKRVGQIILAGEIQDSPSVTFRLPLNRWMRVGDGVRITGDALDLPLPSSKPFQVTEFRKIFDPVHGKAHDIVSSSPGKIGSIFSRGLGNDPLDTRVGIVVAVYRNELGGRVYDVASAGSILYGLKAWPVLGEVGVGEIVQVSRATSGALNYLIVARTTELFSEGRICYV